MPTESSSSLVALMKLVRGCIFRDSSSTIVGTTGPIRTTLTTINIQERTFRSSVKPISLNETVEDTVVDAIVRFHQELGLAFSLVSLAPTSTNFGYLA